MSRNQCELCYSYQDEPLTMVGDECKDKAAMYDIIAHNYKMLVNTLNSVRRDLEEAMKDETPEDKSIQLASSAITQLEIAKQIYGDKAEV